MAHLLCASGASGRNNKNGFETILNEFEPNLEIRDENGVRPQDLINDAQNGSNAANAANSTNNTNVDATDSNETKCMEADDSDEKEFKTDFDSEMTEMTEMMNVTRDDTQNSVDIVLLNWLHCNGLIMFATSLVHCFDSYQKETFANASNAATGDTRGISGISGVSGSGLNLRKLFELEEQELMNVLGRFDSMDGNEIDEEMIGIFVEIWRNDKIDALEGTLLMDFDEEFRQNKRKKKKKKRKV